MYQFGFCPSTNVAKWLFKAAGYKGKSEIVEMIVVGAEKLIVMLEDKRIDEEPNQVDSTCKIVNNYDGKAKEMAPDKTTQFVLALWGLNNDAVTAEWKQQTWAASMNQDAARGVVNPMCGMLIGCETYAVRAAKSGIALTLPKWIHIAQPGQGINDYKAAAQRWAEYEARLRSKATASSPAAPPASAGPTLPAA